jgi:hypothetical protein
VPSLHPFIIIIIIRVLLLLYSQANNDNNDKPTLASSFWVCRLRAEGLVRGMRWSRWPA